MAKGKSPKFKPHSGTKKRFKISGSGKVLHEKPNKGHLLEKKPSRRTRRLTGTTGLIKGDSKRVIKLLGR